MNKKIKKIPLLGVCLFLALNLLSPLPAGAFSEQIIQRGATGDDVVELQSRLQYIGFYNGAIDGVYGWGTYWSVKKYQEQFGLEVDGLVGPKMKAMLEKSTKFDYEWVHKQFWEGRKFTYYGKTPKDIQSGPKGSRIPPLEQARRQRQGATQTPEKGTGQGERQTPEQGVEQGGRQTPSQGTEQSGVQAPERGGGQAPEYGEGQGGQGGAVEGGNQAPAPEPVPTEEPVQEETENQAPNIQEAINVPEGFSENDIALMAQAVYAEARGETYIGQVAIAAVILNRMKSPSFPNTPSGVIYEPRAFTAVADGQINLRPDEAARRAVLDAINGQDPTGGAIYYFNPDTATSGWIWTRPQIKKIGKHIFCK